MIRFNMEQSLNMLCSTSHCLPYHWTRLRDALYTRLEVGVESRKPTSAFTGALLQIPNQAVKLLVINKGRASWIRLARLESKGMRCSKDTTPSTFPAKALWRVLLEAISVVLRTTASDILPPQRSF